MYFVVVVARPRDVLRPLGQRHAHRVHARDERAVVAEDVEGPAAHPGHQPHRHGHIRRVGELDADVALVGADGPHRERHDVHRATLHRAVEELGELLAHLGRLTPVVGRPGVVALRGADERAVLDAGDVARVGERQVAVRTDGVVQTLERACLHEYLTESVVLLAGAVTPVDRVGLGEGGHLLDPADKLLVVRGDSCGAHVRIHLGTVSVLPGSQHHARPARVSGIRRRQPFAESLGRTRPAARPARRPSRPSCGSPRRASRHRGAAATDATCSQADSSDCGVGGKALARAGPGRTRQRSPGR